MAWITKVATIDYIMPTESITTVLYNAHQPEWYRLCNLSATVISFTSYALVIAGVRTVLTKIHDLVKLNMLDRLGLAIEAWVLEPSLKMHTKNC